MVRRDRRMRALQPGGRGQGRSRRRRRSLLLLGNGARPTAFFLVSWICRPAPPLLDPGPGDQDYLRSSELHVFCSGATSWVPGPYRGSAGLSSRWARPAGQTPGARRSRANRAPRKVLTMLRFFIRRVLLAVLTMFVVSVTTFGLFFAVPADPALTMCGARVCPADQAGRIRTSLGLDRPIPVQYAEYMRGIFVGRDVGAGADRIHCPAPCLGVSFRNRLPV